MRAYEGKVTGHSLVKRGSPHNMFGTRIVEGRPGPGVPVRGRCKCSCGWFSGYLDSNAARKRAYSGHKLDESWAA